jgi:hypothetical protein
MKYFKVIVGFGDNDYVEIDEDEVEKCMKAQITGKVVITRREGSISGSIIQRIAPDYGRSMGFRRGYKLTGEDYSRIGSKVIAEHQKTLEEAGIRVQEAFKGPSAPRITGTQAPDTKALADKFKI